MRGARAHEWVGATEVALSRETAAEVASRGRVTMSAVAVLVVVDVYCRRCRQSYSRQREADGCHRGMVLRGGPRLPGEA
jgi:hypothetical protein